MFVSFIIRIEMLLAMYASCLPYYVNAWFLQFLVFLRDDDLAARLDEEIAAVGATANDAVQRVARLEQETGVKVRSDKETPYITLIGTPRAVAQARVQVLAILALAELPPMPGAPPPEAPPAAEVPVPGEAIGKVMGKAGLNIKATQCRTGCFMNWDKNARVMRLWGAEDVVAAGRDAIERDISDALAEREQGNPRAASRDEFGEPADRPRRAPDPVVSEEVPTRGHGGLVIGRGGENVKRIERESGGARMKMHREKQVVVVTGFADQVARAVRLVEACVERAVALAERKELSGARGSAPGARDAARAAWTLSLIHI